MAEKDSLPEPSGVEYDGMLFTDADMQDMINRKRQEQDQKLMREEMSAHPKAGPEALAPILDRVLGGSSITNPELATRAHELIEEHGEGLTLGLKQWAIVQKLIETALHEGQQWLDDAETCSEPGHLGCRWVLHHHPDDPGRAES